MQWRPENLFSLMPGSLCLTHLPTWWSCAQWIKLSVSQHLKVKENALLRSDGRTAVVSVRKSSKSDFCLTCASAAKRPWWSPGCCCGSLTPPSGARSLSDSDPGCTWDSGVWWARWKLHQPATKKTEEGKDELLFTSHSCWCMWHGGSISVSEEETLCSSLPGTDCSARGDSKCVGSRR